MRRTKPIHRFVRRLNCAGKITKTCLLLSAYGADEPLELPDEPLLVEPLLPEPDDPPPTTTGGEAGTST